MTVKIADGCNAYLNYYHNLFFGPGKEGIIDDFAIIPHVDTSKVFSTVLNCAFTYLKAHANQLFAQTSLSAQRIKTSFAKMRGKPLQDAHTRRNSQGAGRSQAVFGLVRQLATPPLPGGIFIPHTSFSTLILHSF
jgi:hypothetical protein